MSPVVFQILSGHHLLGWSAFVQRSHGSNWGMDHEMMWTGTVWFGGIFMILFWILILVGIVLLVSWLKNSSKGEGRRPSPDRESPMDILKRRYASGEITKEQFEWMKRDIEG